MKTMCDRIGCEKEAAVKGFILARNGGENGEDIPVDVNTCSKHRKCSGFFETEVIVDERK